MTAKVTPSTSRRGRTAWPGSTNWGRNVTKKTPSFGLLIAERNPCRKTAWAGAAGGGAAGRGGGPRPGAPPGWEARYSGEETPARPSAGKNAAHATRRGERAP